MFHGPMPWYKPKKRLGQKHDFKNKFQIIAIINGDMN